MRDDPDNGITAGLDRSEVEPCANCRKPLMHNAHMLFYELTIQLHGLDMHSIRQQHGLEMMLGGNAGIAAALAPSTEISKRLGGRIRPKDQPPLVVRRHHSIHPARNISKSLQPPLITTRGRLHERAATLMLACQKCLRTARFGRLLISSESGQ